MKLLHSRELAPNWLRQVGRAVLALGLGVFVGLSASEPKLLLGVAALISLVLVVSSLRRPDPFVFLAFAVVVMPKVRIPGSPVPAGEVMMLIAVASAWLTRGRDHLVIPRWFRNASIALVGVYLFSSVVNVLFDYSMMKRMVHIGVFVLVALCLGREMLPTRVAVKGLTVGLVGAALSGLLLISRSAYKGRLTGVFGDPNVAGFLLVVLGPVVLSRIEKRVPRLCLAAFFVVAITLTLSRTALLAVIVFAVWVAVGSRLKRKQSLLVIGLSGSSRPVSRASGRSRTVREATSSAPGCRPRSSPRSASPRSGAMAPGRRPFESTRTRSRSTSTTVIWRW